jgi:hypothetical protein
MYMYTYLYVYHTYSHLYVLIVCTYRLAASIAALVGVTVYRTFLKDVSIKTIILWTTLISIPLSLTQLMLVTHYNRVLGIPDQLFALTDTVVLTVLGKI